jgi:hypothetical protein
MSSAELEERIMVANTLLVTIAVLQGYLFWLLGELKFLISYKRTPIPRLQHLSPLPHHAPAKD